MLGRIGLSDGESIGGSFESLSSPGKYMAVCIYVTVPYSHENLAKANMIHCPVLVSLLY